MQGEQHGKTLSMNLTNKNIIVTGAGGFIGSHLTEALLERARSVKAFVRYTSSGSIGLLSNLPKKILKDIEIVRGDIRDQEFVENVLTGMDLCFHLASQISIPHSYIGIRETADTNYYGTLNVLLAAHKLTMEKVLYASTSEVYGTAQTSKISESHRLNAQSPYAATKIAAEKLVESFYASFNLSGVIVRPFNTFGPRQSTRAVIPAIISQSLAGEKIELGALEPSRDFTYISDTVEGLIAAANSNGLDGQIFNLGFGQDISIGSLVDKISSIIGKKLQIQTKSHLIRPKEGEVMRLCSDNSLIASQTNWQPKVPLYEGLAMTIDWFRENSAGNAVSRTFR